MDIEKGVRECLIRYLEPHFVVLEEARLTGQHGALRCDVLAQPKDLDFQRYIFAFECKRPSKEWHYAKWAKAIKQACDYVGAETTAESAKMFGVGRRVTCSFVFPAPFETPSEVAPPASNLVRDGFENSVAGMFHLALMFRTGRARANTVASGKHLFLALGPTQVWSSSTGFYFKSHDLLSEGRPFGATNRK